MWCVASAPIVPLTRDLDAGLGLSRVERAAHCRPRPTPSQAAPAFLHKVSHSASHSPTPPSNRVRVLLRRVPCHFLAPASLSQAAPAFSPQGAHAAPTLRGQSPRLPAPAPRPARLHAIPSAWAPPQWGLSSENTKKRAPFLGERCSFWVAKRSTFGRVVLTCATMGGHTDGKCVRRRGLACATCAVDLIDATLYFGIAAGESVFAHLAVAIDAAHHFAGGLFHTARGRLCGRGGRGRRRGGRARSRCGNARCGSSLGRR